MSFVSNYENMPPASIGRAPDTPVMAEPGSTSDGAFEALLYPNRSLPNRGFIAVMSIVIIVNLTLGLTFFTLGAWPVLGFCGLDILFVWLAFKLSYRQGRLHERIRLTADALWVSRVLPSGHETRWHLEPYWVTVEIDRPDAHEARISLVSKGKRLILGSFLSPKERVAFGKRLQEALLKARMVER